MAPLDASQLVAALEAVHQTLPVAAPSEADVPKPEKLRQVQLPQNQPAPAKKSTAAQLGLSKKKKRALDKRIYKNKNK